MSVSSTINSAPIANTHVSYRLLRLKQVKEQTGLSRSYIYDLVKRDLFPKSVPLVPGGTSRAWVESEVKEWIERRIEARNQEMV